MTRAITRAFAPAALIFAASLALVGCAAPTVTDPNTDTDTPTEETAPESTVDPATGPVITGDGYSYNVPEGWADPEQSLPGFNPDSFAADLADTDGFTDNVNVLLSPAGEITPDQVEEAGVAELEGVGATEVEARDRISIAGSESAHLTALFSAEGTEYWVEQYYPTNAGQTYVVTFSFSPTVAAADREALAESVLASWQWA